MSLRQTLRFAGILTMFGLGYGSMFMLSGPLTPPWSSRPTPDETLAEAPAQSTRVRLGSVQAAAALRPPLPFSPPVVLVHARPEATPRPITVQARSAFLEQVLHQPKRLPLLTPEDIDEETLWLARCIYSETQVAQEMLLVAWVVRNRVDTRYRGQHTYQEVVLDPQQFSAFNPNHPKRDYYSTLVWESEAYNWQRALHLAWYVRHARSSERPFSRRTRHFFSEASMPNDSQPEWAVGQEALDIANVDEERFRFYSGVY
jgi:hypothetical protein